MSKLILKIIVHNLIFSPVKLSLNFEYIFFSESGEFYWYLYSTSPREFTWTNSYSWYSNNGNKEC